MTMQTVFKSPADEQAAMARYDAILNMWQIPWTTRQIPTRHGDTFTIVCGNEAAPPLVLLHGAGGNSAMWSADVDQLSHHFRIYAVDLVGEAGKSAPVRPTWDSPAFAEWLADVLDGLQIEAATLVGISQGGWTAIKFAVTAPHRVTKLVLIAPGGVVRDRPWFLLRVMTLSLFGKRGIKQLSRSLFGDEPVPDSVIEDIVQTMNAFKPRVGVLPMFTDAELRRLTMPVFVLGGTRDVIRDMPRIAERLRALLPDVTVKIIAGAGHAMTATARHFAPFLGM